MEILYFCGLRSCLRKNRAIPAPAPFHPFNHIEFDINKRLARHIRLNMWIFTIPVNGKMFFSCLATNQSTNGPGCHGVERKNYLFLPGRTSSFPADWPWWRWENVSLRRRKTNARPPAPKCPHRGLHFLNLELTKKQKNNVNLELSWNRNILCTADYCVASDH